MVIAALRPSEQLHQEPGQPFKRSHQNILMQSMSVRNKRDSSPYLRGRPGSSAGIRSFGVGVTGAPSHGSSGPPANARGAREVVYWPWSTPVTGSNANTSVVQQQQHQRVSASMGHKDGGDRTVVATTTSSMSAATLAWGPSRMAPSASFSANKSPFMSLLNQRPASHYGGRRPRIQSSQGQRRVSVSEALSGGAMLGNTTSNFSVSSVKRGTFSGAVGAAGAPARPGPGQRPMSQQLRGSRIWSAPGSAGVNRKKPSPSPPKMRPPTGSVASSSGVSSHGPSASRLVSSRATPASSHASTTGSSLIGIRSRPKVRKWTCGSCCSPGGRPYMEDVVLIRPYADKASKTAMYAVFDGHAGRKAADFVSARIVDEALQDLSREPDVMDAMRSTFLRLDSMFLDVARQQGLRDGCTAVVMLIQGDRLTVANAGDSRAVLSRAGRAIPLSIDHKPDRKDEVERIESLGGRVLFSSTWRVQGVLAVSRAFGDLDLKPYVSVEPEFRQEMFTAQDDFILMGSDGLWDVLSNQEAVDFATELLEQFQGDADQTCQALVDIAFNRGSMDNVSVLLVQSVVEED